jgi:signal transduction histidine kinase
VLTAAGPTARARADQHLKLSSQPLEVSGPEGLALPQRGIGRDRGAVGPPAVRAGERMKSAEREPLLAPRARPGAGSRRSSRRPAVPEMGSGSPGSTLRRALSDPLVQDALVASALTAASLVGLLVHLHIDLPEGGTDVRNRSLDTIGLTLALLQTVPLIWRRVAPVAVLGVCSSAMFLFFYLGYFPSFASFGFLLALYSVAAHRERRISIPAAIASTAVVLMLLIVSREPIEPDTIFAECLVVGAVWFIGDGLRVKRSQVISLEDRASRFEREREEAAQKAVAEERRVIARELHDMVAHNVSVMVAQSGAAQRVFDTQPEEGRAALRSIEDSGREALVEMRRLLGLLRTDDDRPDVRYPQRGLGGIETLLAQVREAGLPVELRVEGAPRPLPAGLDLSAFRIVQEALTNVLKHAGPAHAAVVIRYSESGLDLTISDDGWGFDAPDTDPLRARYGHLGMRERVGLFRGQLRVGPRLGGGYHVTASLPLDPDPT